MSDIETRAVPANRTLVNDGPIPLSDQLELDTQCIEVFLRSVLKPINNNEDDPSGKNYIVAENFSLEPLKRVYMQDFYRSLLSTDTLYDKLTVTKADSPPAESVKVISNLVTVTANTGNGDLNRAINAEMAKIHEVELQKSWFHSNIEFAEGNATRRQGLYDYQKLIDFNNNRDTHLFELGLLEQVFDEENRWLQDDIERENYVVSLQTIARRIVELFARLSNLRMSFLFFTDIMTNYRHHEVVAALDIFYNMLSRMSEAHRVAFETPSENPSAKDDVKKRYAWTAHFNKQVFQMMRPSVFVLELVTTMMNLVTSRDSTDTKIHSYYLDLRNDKIIKKSGNKWVWFARESATKGDLEGSEAWKNSFKNGAKSCLESFTGLHLKLIPHPDGDWNDGRIKDALQRGFDYLLDAFGVCLNDSEVLKFIDTSSNTPVATNLQYLIKNNYTVSSKDSENGKMKDAFTSSGELQFALILERIFAKVYYELGVKSSSYFIPKRPRLNIDVALRFLTDNTISHENQLENYRSAYSSIPAYVDRISALKGTRGFPELNVDTADILENVVTEKHTGSARILRPQQTYLLEKYSLCPYRYDSFTGRTEENDSGEKQVGGNSFVSYPAQPVIKCPFADTTADGLEKCRLLYSVIKDPNPEPGQPGMNDIKNVPLGCPAALALKLDKYDNWGRDGYVSRLVPSNMVNYIHTIFKKSFGTGTIPTENTWVVNPTVSPQDPDPEKRSLIPEVTSEDGKKAQIIKEEIDALGWASSININKGYTGVGMSDDPEKVTTYRTDEANGNHSQTRLIYLSQLINLCTDLFKVNQYITFNEPYLKTYVRNANEYYYGSETAGSFEPISCYRFSNFHASNTADSRKNSQLKYRARYSTTTTQYITAINRDLSGETSFAKDTSNKPNTYEGGNWGQKELLDNRKKVVGSTKEEYKLTYPRYTLNDVKNGIIESSSANAASHDGAAVEFYKIRMLPELKTAKTASYWQLLMTYEVYVKRFRPIILPDANDLFCTTDADKRDPTNKSISPAVLGWSPLPHKYTTDNAFGKNSIIIPMNVSSRNPPRGKWFHELDWEFAEARKTGSTYTAGYCTFNAKGEPSMIAKNPNTPEWMDFFCYNTRDWMYPVSMRLGQEVRADHSALGRVEGSVKSVYDKKASSGANKYTLGTAGNISMRSGNFVVDTNNLKYFDIMNYKGWDGGDNWSMSTNWLYITTPPPDIPGTEVSQSVAPLPWVFWHSPRGGKGEKPHYWQHGLAHPFQGHENGLCDSDSRWFAVDRILAQNPAKMIVAGKYGTFNKKTGKWEGRVDMDAVAKNFYKGYYDPSCAGSSTRWHTHERTGWDRKSKVQSGNHKNAAYGWPNASDNETLSKTNKNGPRPDKYWNPYNSAGEHVLCCNTYKNDKGDVVQDDENWAEALNFKKARGGKFDNANGTDYNETIVDAIKGRPMTWSMWNVIRHTLWMTFNVSDPDYNPNDSKSEDRSKQKINDPTIIEEKTFATMRELYREWYKRFTYPTDSGDKYTSQAGVTASTKWPYHKKDSDPDTYGEAQKIQGGLGATIGGGNCNIEWSNLLADMSILYNEVSDTHDSCLTFYVGSHPRLYSGKSGRNSPTYQAKGEFNGKITKKTPTGVSNTAPENGWTSKAPFRYTVPGVDMCRNFMAFIYGGYNSTVPRGDGYYENGKKGNGDASNKYQPIETLPANLSTGTTTKTVNIDGKPYKIENRVNYGTEYYNKGKLKSVYPSTEENDDETFDSNFVQRFFIPIYPCWENLHDKYGNPIHPDVVTMKQYKEIVFTIAPMTYWEPWYGNKGNEKKKTCRQLGERMMGFCISQFFFGEKAEKLVGKAVDNEFIREVTDTNIEVQVDGPVHHFNPHDPPWGEAFQHQNNVHPGNWNANPDYHY